MKYKGKNKFKVWNYHRRKMLRYKIYKVVHELDGREQRLMITSGEKINLLLFEP